MAAPKTDNTGQLIPSAQAENALVRAKRWLDEMQSEIIRALPRHVTPERMMRVLQTAMSRPEHLVKAVEFRQLRYLKVKED